MSTLDRWPLAAGATALVATAVGVDLSSGPGTGLALAMMMLAAACIGAWIHAEGVRASDATDPPASETPGDP